MSEVKVDTISERTTDAGVTVEGVKIEDGVATFQTAAGSPLVFEGATADAFETTFAITDPTADRTITFPDSSFTVPTSSGGLVKLASTEVTTGVAAVIFDSSVVTAYDNYLIIVNGVKTAASAANGTIAFSTDNGSAMIGYTRFTAAVIDVAAGASGGYHYGFFTSDSVAAPILFDNHSTEPLNGAYYFFNCNPETDNTYSVWSNYTDSYTNQSGTEYYQNGAVAWDVTAGQQINYFKLLNATQNISEGRVTLYGFSQ